MYIGLWYYHGTDENVTNHVSAGGSKIERISYKFWYKKPRLTGKMYGSRQRKMWDKLVNGYRNLNAFQNYFLSSLMVSSGKVLRKMLYQWYGLWFKRNNRN